MQLIRTPVIVIGCEGGLGLTSDGNNGVINKWRY